MRLSDRLCVSLALAAAAGAHGAENEHLTSDAWQPFPTRWGTVYIHKDCIHDVEDGFHVKPGVTGDNITNAAGRTRELPPCPHPPRREVASTKEANVRYYSDWAVYVQDTHDAGYSYMSSDWVVPKAPESSGPVPGMSSAYLFNGLENSGGHAGTASFILQPVLSHGKSGCIVNPANYFRWFLTSFHVTDAGRAYCGARLPVDEGEKVRGIMSLGEDSETWTIQSIRLGSNQTSTHSVSLSSKATAAYLTLETMVNYNCKAFPASGSIDFVNNVLKDLSGNAVTPQWKPVLKHHECHQGVRVSGTDVTLSWDAEAATAEAATAFVV
eukprot:TRINITY_DN93361_c0_g1_i1.p1 TRINITY_DN93361_c0_g1~~TRINITY_DN93361_c0_g1_i1.p1  ORF type:complete len:326 (-),score=47.09 TRINITY_DN93361_c0_g1_i1:345-1322(-)